MRSTTWLNAGTITLTLICGLYAAGPASAVNLTPEESETLSAPLSPDDPRAQADPELQSILNVEEPAPGATSTARRRLARRTVEHDMATGETHVKRVRLRALRDQVAAFESDYVGQVAVEGASADSASSSLSTGDSMARVIFGTDDRIPMPLTVSYPMRSFVKLFIKWPNGKSGGCSGTLVAAKYVLTAAHCLVSDENGGFATKIEVIPGYYNGYRPFGSAFATNLRTTLWWFHGNGSPDGDYGLVTLDRRIGDSTGWLGLHSGAIPKNANIMGYPGDRCSGHCLYADSDPVFWAQTTAVYYLTDTYKGQSGSGVYDMINGAYRVFAVHRGQCSSLLPNCGPRMNTDRVALISSWINSNT